jgi:predicted double-glycine peptidase
VLFSSSKNSKIGGSKMFVPFVGNGYYCFTNSLYMVLEGSNAVNLPGTYFIECLTTMPFGNTYLALEDNPLIFFSGSNIDPDKGLSLAIEALGWEAEEYFGNSPEYSLEKLSEAVKLGPVLVGPVDLGYLTYNPNHRNLIGIDHFVVVLDIADENILLHDPAGFPFASIPTQEFLTAWEAKNVAYKRGPYTFRYNFRQVKNVSHQEMISKTVDRIPVNLSFNPGGPVVYGGIKALQLLSDNLKDPIPPKLYAHLVWFALPLAARRATDAARFFKEAKMLECVNIHLEKAKMFGQANYYAVRKNWRAVTNILDSLIKLEEKFILVLDKS